MSTKLIQGLNEEQTKTFTLNGAATYSSSLNVVLDLFFKIGAFRKASETDILRAFTAAWNEHSLKAMKILFWSRDVRGGAGERRTFRTIIRFLGQHYPDLIEKNISLIPEFGRWDDLHVLLDTKARKSALKAIKQGLKEENGLLAKWLPRKGPIAKAVRDHLKFNPKKYRKTLVSLSNTVEQKMCAKDWSEINYEQVPSIAINKYSRAFYKHDTERYQGFMEKVKKGEAKIKAGAIFPHDVIRGLRRDAETANLQWRALPDYIGESEERFITVNDVSGSMNGLPMEVCVALGIYLSERNKSIFKDAFITFSSTPKLQHLTGNLLERVLQLESAEWGMSTNLDAVFDLLLKTATKNKLKQKDMPTTILIMSDMQFNQCVEGKSAMDMIRKKYEDAGYKVPKVVFWLLNSTSDNVPVRFNEKGVALVSGFSPSIMTSLLHGDMNPVKVMDRTIESPRYAKVTV